MFSKFDLRNRYHQIPVEPKDHYKTAFACHYGSFEFTVMQFGFKNAPSHFQHQITVLLGDLVDKCVVVYLNDIPIFSKNRSEHEAHVREVFNRLQNMNFTLNVRNPIHTQMRLTFLDIQYHPLELKLYPARFVQLRIGLNPLVHVE